MRLVLVALVAGLTGRSAAQLPVETVLQNVHKLTTLSKNLLPYVGQLGVENAPKLQSHEGPWAVGSYFDLAVLLLVMY